MSLQPGRALYRQIAADIRAQIDSGELKPGDKLPSRRQLSAIYEVSETVISYAMVELRALGLVYGQPGRSVYITRLPDRH